MDVIAEAADVIEPYLHGKFRIRDRAEGSARDLHTYGLLRGGVPTGDAKLSVQERAVNILQCRQSQPVAERIVADLEAAGLLAEVTS